MLDAGSMLTVPLHRRQVCRTKEHDFEVWCSRCSFELRSLLYSKPFLWIYIGQKKIKFRTKTLGSKIFSFLGPIDTLRPILSRSASWRNKLRWEEQTYKPGLDARWCLAVDLFPTRWLSSKAPPNLISLVTFLIWKGRAR